jgi:RNA polymerase sigma-70 factor, ECF subfamily
LRRLPRRGMRRAELYIRRRGALRLRYRSMEPKKGKKDGSSADERFLAAYDEYYGPIFGYILRGVRDRAAAEDLASETFFKALRRMRNADDVRFMKAWLYRIATNEILMHHRFYRKKSFVDFDAEELRAFLDSNGRGSEDPHREAELLALRQAMEMLKPGEKAMIEMRYLEKIDYGEMSRILGKKEASLRSTVHRALKKLKLLMAGDEP